MRDAITEEANIKIWVSKTIELAVAVAAGGMRGGGAQLGGVELAIAAAQAAKPELDALVRHLQGAFVVENEACADVCREYAKQMQRATPHGDPKAFGAAYRAIEDHPLAPSKEDKAAYESALRIEGARACSGRIREGGTSHLMWTFG